MEKVREFRDCGGRGVIVGYEIINGKRAGELISIEEGERIIALNKLIANKAFRISVWEKKGRT